MRPIPLLLCSTILALLPSVRPAASQPVSCESSFSDPATGLETTLSLRIDAPSDGAHQVRWDETGCTLEVEGWASSLGIPTLFDFYLVIDHSTSTADSSGVDLNGDGRDESILEVEIAAAKAFVQAVGFEYHRIALIPFSGSAEVLVHLTDPGALLLPALNDLALNYDGGTSFGDGVKAALAEHREHPAPDREQVVLFLSDGEAYDWIPPPPGPLLPCSFDAPACSGVRWAAEAHEQGLNVHTFGIGHDADLVVLAEMAAVGGGSFVNASSPADILEALPGLAVSGIESVEIENRTTGDTIAVDLLPDGRFMQAVPALEGLPNELLVRVRSSELASAVLECGLEATVSCIRFGCPPDVSLHCAGEQTQVDGLVAWVDDPDVTVLVFPDRTRELDASGPRRVGTTAVTWRFDHPLAGRASCQTLVEVTDDAPPSISVSPLVLMASCDDVPPPTAATVDDLCDPAPRVFSTQTRIDGPCAGTYTLERRRWAMDRAGNSSEVVVQEVQVQDLEPPSLDASPADLEVPCEAVPPPETVGATDLCDPEPIVALHEGRIDGPCPGTYTLERRWTASDDCGNESSHLQVVEVVDRDPPTLVLPASFVIECDAEGGVPASHPEIVAWLAEASASDACGLAVLDVDMLELLPAACAPGATTEVLFTAVDECGLESSSMRTITVVDTTPPQLSVPGPAVFECSEPGGLPASTAAAQAWLAAASAADACGETVITHDAPEHFISGCLPDGATTTVTFTATDGCGLTSSLSSTVTVRDTTPPSLDVPAPIVLECSAPGGVEVADPSVQAWLAAASAEDACGAVNLVHDAPAFLPAGCAPGLLTAVRFTATDGCGLVSEASSSVTVVDTTPPIVAASDEDLACLWPPNHRLVPFVREDFAPMIEDLCASEPLTWRFVACVSDQADDGLGDGNTEEDCLVSPDGSTVLVRSERSGLLPAGRRYALYYTASDGCGNESAPAQLGSIHVPHDSRAHGACRNATKEGLRPGADRPF